MSSAPPDAGAEDPVVVVVVLEVVVVVLAVVVVVIGKDNVEFTEFSKPAQPGALGASAAIAKPPSTIVAAPELDAYGRAPGLFVVRFTAKGPSGHPVIVPACDQSISRRPARDSTSVEGLTEPKKSPRATSATVTSPIEGFGAPTFTVTDRKTSAERGMVNEPSGRNAAVAVDFVESPEIVSVGVTIDTSIENWTLPGFATMAPALETIPGTANVNESAHAAIDTTARPRRRPDLRPDILQSDMTGTSLR